MKTEMQAIDQYHSVIRDSKGKERVVIFQDKFTDEILRVAVLPN
jgi:hypothetical protein